MSQFLATFRVFEGALVLLFRSIYAYRSVFNERTHEESRKAFLNFYYLTFGFNLLSSVLNENITASVTGACQLTLSHCCSYVRFA